MNWLRNLKATQHKVNANKKEGKYDRNITHFSTFLLWLQSAKSFHICISGAKVQLKIKNYELRVKIFSLSLRSYNYKKTSLHLPMT
jgi:hypothetical protein